MADETEGPANPTGQSSDVTVENFKASIEYQKALNKLKLEEANLAMDRVRLSELNAQKEELELKAIADKIAKSEALSKVEQDRFNLLAAQRREGEGDLELVSRRRALLQESLDDQRQANQFASGIAAKLGLQAKYANTTAGKFLFMAANLKRADKSISTLADNLFNMLTPSNLAAGFLSKVVESVIMISLQLDKTNTEFKKLTGFSGDFKNNMIAVADASADSGVSIADAGKAMGAFATNFSKFNPDKVNDDIITNVALLEKIGVAAADSTKSMDFMVRAFGMSEDAALEMSRGIAMAGDSMGITAGRMISDFNAVAGELAGFGDQMENIFLDLQAQAKATGMEVSSLVGIAKSTQQQVVSIH